MHTTSLSFRLLAQLTTFGLVGLVGTSAHYLVLWLLVEQAGRNVVASTTAGFVVGAVVNYVLNRRVTFTSDVAHAAALPKFLTVAVAGACMNAAVMAALAEWAGVHYLLAQIVATLAVFIWNFAANYLWTFRVGPGESA